MIQRSPEERENLVRFRGALPLQRRKEKTMEPVEDDDRDSDDDD